MHWVEIPAQIMKAVTAVQASHPVGSNAILNSAKGSFTAAISLSYGLLQCQPPSARTAVATAQTRMQVDCFVDMML